MKTSLHEFPLSVLPEAFEIAALAAGRFGLAPGAASMALITFFGAAVGGRVRVNCLTREHSLNLPLGLVIPPVDEVTVFLNQFVEVFSSERRRLDDLRSGNPEFLAEEKRCRELLNLEGRVVPPTPIEVTSLRRRLRECVALRAHDFLDSIQSRGEVFDGHRLAFDRQGKAVADLLQSDGRGRQELVDAMRDGFNHVSERSRLAVVMTLSRAQAIQTLRGWLLGAPTWPMLFVENQAGFHENIVMERATPAVEAVRVALQRQLRLRYQLEPVALNAGEFATASINCIVDEISQLSGEILIPAAYSHFASITIRLAAILHVMDAEEPVDATISETAWRGATEISSWLLRQQHPLASGLTGQPNTSEKTPTAKVKRHPRMTSNDPYYFMKNLARVQPATWRTLLQRLPKRHPGYWCVMRENLIRSGIVRETAGRLVILKLNQAARGSPEDACRTV